MDTRYIGEAIEVVFDELPLLAKKPGCPNGFVWGEKGFAIVEVLAEWHDYERRGRMARNMQPAHLERARQRGSWGVGRDFYRVRTQDGRVFELYYDRAPKDASHGSGSWVLRLERFPGAAEN